LSNGRDYILVKSIVIVPTGHPEGNNLSSRTALHFPFDIRNAPRNASTQISICRPAQTRWLKIFYGDPI
jgi:hypothetical protein